MCGRTKSICFQCGFECLQKNLTRHFQRKHDDLLIEKGIDPKDKKAVTSFRNNESVIAADDGYVSDKEVEGYEICQARNGRPGTKRGASLKTGKYFVKAIDDVFLKLSGADDGIVRILIGYVRNQLHRDKTSFLEILAYLSNEDNVSSFAALMMTKMKLHGMFPKVSYACDE